MNIVVIGGTGHVGSFLIPRLVRAGHRVTEFSRGSRSPYHPDPAWSEVRRVTVDRESEDAAGTFAGRVAAEGADTVIDMVCFTLDSAEKLVEGLRGNTPHLVSCGSIWKHGPSPRAPLLEDTPTTPFGEYGTQKAAIARFLAAETHAGGLATTSLHPGHISGPGWAPVGPLGNLDPSVWQRLAAGQVLAVPGIGAELLSHVHADDVAQAFQLAAEKPAAASGREFHATAASALTVRGFAQAAAGWFGREVHLEHLTWDSFRAQTSAEFADQSWAHLVRSHHVSIEAARTVLGYEPAHTPEAAARAGVKSLVEQGVLQIDQPFVEE